MTLGIFYPHSLIVTGGFELTQLESSIDPSFGIDEVTETASGNIFPGFTGSSMSEAALDFSTTQVATVLTNIGVTEGVAKSYSATNVDLEWQKGENLAARISDVTTTHARMRATESLFYWKGISADPKGNAKIDVRWKPISDGTNPPWVFANAALTGTPTVSELYTLGPVVLNSGAGAVTLCNDGWTWSNNIQEKAKSCSGGEYDIYAAIENVAPTATVKLENVDIPLGLLPLGASITSVDFYLRKRTQGGGNVAPATAQHIKLSSTVGAVRPQGAKQLNLAMHSFTFSTTSALP